MRNISPLVGPMILALFFGNACCSVSAAETKPPTKKPMEFTFNKDEAAFLASLVERGKDVKSMVLLLGIAQTVDLPKHLKKPEDLVISLVKEKISVIMAATPFWTAILTF